MDHCPWYKCKKGIIWYSALLQVTRGACNPHLQVVITHASRVCSQHSFALPLRMYGMHRTQFDHARLDLLSLKIWSREFDYTRFWPSVKWKLHKAQHGSKSVLTFDRCRPHDITFPGYYYYLLIYSRIQTAETTPQNWRIWLAGNQGCHGQGKVREKQTFFKVREKSGNFLKSHGKSLILSKSVKSQGILFSGL